MEYLMFLIFFIATGIGILGGWGIPKYYAWKNGFPDRRRCNHFSCYEGEAVCKKCGYVFH